MQPMSHAFASSRVHPGSWWLLGLCGAFAANLAANLWFSSQLILAAVALILICRDESSRAQGIGFYLAICGFVVAVRIGLHLIFQAEPVTGLSLWIAGGDALKLAAVIMAVAVANTLASPRELLRSTPKALYELAAAVAIAINLAPQLIISLQRVRRAAALRGRSKGLRAFTSILIPTLEDAMQRSLDLAASMSVRGFGTRNPQSRAIRRLSTLAAIASLSMIGLATYSLMSSADGTVGMCLALTSLMPLVLFVRLQGTGVMRTRFRHRALVWQDAVLAVLGIAVLVVAWRLSLPVVGD